MNSLRIDNSNTDTQLSNTEGISKPQDKCKDGEISPHKIQFDKRVILFYQTYPYPWIK